jgi:hypothetical protein
MARAIVAPVAPAESTTQPGRLAQLPTSAPASPPPAAAIFAAALPFGGTMQSGAMTWNGPPCLSRPAWHAVEARTTPFTIALRFFPIAP